MIKLFKDMMNVGMKTVLLLILTGLAIRTQAQDVIVESRSGGLNFSKYSEDTSGFPNGWSSSSAKSTAAGLTAGIGSRFNSSSAVGGADVWFEVNPTLPVAGGTYKVYATVTSASGALSVTSTITQTGCTGLPETTTAFSTPGNVWNLIGTMTLNPGVTSPTIRFDETANDNRFYADAIKFVLDQPCLTVSQPSVTGPLSEDNSNVVVRGVSPDATQITVYQNSGVGGAMVALGSKTSGIVSNENIVAVAGLIKGKLVGATQTIGGQESCVPSTGTFVGGGANPRLRIVFGIRENTSLTGPIGANGGATGRVFFLGTTNVLTGTVPGTDALVLQPSTNWQTVTYTPNVDHQVVWSPSTSVESIQGTFATIDGISIANDDLTDNGPFELYIDNLKNGSTVIQDWESPTNGTLAYGLYQPSFSGAPSSGNLLSSPDESIVVNNVADTGSQSLRIRFQFADNSASRWVRLSAFTGVGGTPNPEIDLSQPVSVRVLLLPVGATAPSAPAITYNLSGSTLTLNWTGVYNLESKTNLSDANWSSVGISNAPYVVSITNAATFYRLHNP